MKEQTPEISVIVPVYNMERYLRQCIESVLSQTFADLELILVDDGSTDSSLAICREYEARDSRVRVIAKANGGVSDSRNAALRVARGEFVGFVDSDDWIEPGMYRRLYSDMMEYDADIAICGYTFEWKNRSKLRHDPDSGVRVFDRDTALRLLFNDDPIQSMACDKLFRRSLITAEFPKDYYFEDHATTIKWFYNARRVVFDPESFYHYRMRAGSTVNGMNPARRYHFLVAEIGRADFLRSKGFLDSSDPAAGAGRVLAVAIDVAKNIARYNMVPSERYEYLARVVKVVAPYLPAAESVLAGKKLRRLRRLLSSPRSFVRMVRFSHMFEFGRRNKRNNLFE